MRMLRAALVIAGLFSLSGCAAIALTAGGIAGGTGIDHTLSGISYKTFASPMQNVRLATLKTLNQFAMDVTADKKVEDGWEIQAKAIDREIDIELETVTRRATRMRVVVNKGDIFFKDAATGTEIIIKTAEHLERQAASNDIGR